MQALPQHLRCLGIGNVQLNLISESDHGNKNLHFHLFFLRKRIQHILNSFVQIVDFISGHAAADIQKQNDGKRLGGRCGMPVQRPGKRDPGTCQYEHHGLGDNLPARNVVIVGVHRGLARVDELNIIQMAGRAGRYGIDDEGHVNLIIPEGERSHWTGVFQSPRPVISVLNDSEKLAFHILAEICTKTIRNRSDLYNWYHRSLAHLQGVIPLTRDGAEYVIRDLIRMHMIKEQNAEFTITSLGRISAVMYFYPQDICAWLKNFNLVFNNGLEREDDALCWALASTPMNRMTYVPKDCNDIVSAWKKRLEALSIRPNKHDLLSAAAISNCLEAREDQGVIASKMWEFLNDAERILRTLQMIDERCANWRKSDIWQNLEKRTAIIKDKQKAREQHWPN
jgi:replicative superfamily II helicase